LEIIQAKKWYAFETYLKEADVCTAIFVSSLKTINNEQKTSNF